MDTISSERSPSLLPIGALVAGVAALILGFVVLAKVSAATKALEASEARVTEVSNKLDGVSSSISTIQAAADKAARDVSSLQRGTQGGFDTVGAELASLRGAVTKLEETQKAPPQKAATKSGEPVVAGPGEYVVKKGDIGTSIARANGVSITDLIAVNPGVNWNALKVGQKVKLPKK